MRLLPQSFVSDQTPLLLMLYLAGKTFGRSPSTWLAMTTDPRSAVADQMFALDFDAACLFIGLDAERVAQERATNQ